jgi:hypothetical protein
LEFDVVFLEKVTALVSGARRTETTMKAFNYNRFLGLCFLLPVALGLTGLGPPLKRSVGSVSEEVREMVQRDLDAFFRELDERSTTMR